MSDDDVQADSSIGTEVNPRLEAALRRLVYGVLTDDERDRILAESPDDDPLVFMANEAAAKQRMASDTVDDLEAKYETLASRVDRIETSVGRNPSSKRQAVIKGALNRSGRTTGGVAMTPNDIVDLTGVTQRYAYDLVDDMADDLPFCSLRPPVQPVGGRKQTKALLVHLDDDADRRRAEAFVRPDSDDH